MALKTQQQLIALCKSIKTKGANLNQEIQEVAIGAIGHSVMHGNVMVADVVANAVLAAMSNGHRKQALVHYLECFGNLQYKRGEKKKGTPDKFVYKASEKSWTDEYEASLRSVMWCDFTKESTITSMYDAEADVNRMLKRILNKAAAGDCKNAEVYDYIKPAMEKYEQDKQLEIARHMAEKGLTENTAAPVVAQAA